MWRLIHEIRGSCTLFLAWLHAHSGHYPSFLKQFGRSDSKSVPSRFQIIWIEPLE